ncbi:MAG: CHAT domain-containing protein [Planctomycetota bacterium]
MPGAVADTAGQATAAPTSRELYQSVLELIDRRDSEAVRRHVEAARLQTHDYFPWITYKGAEHLRTVAADAVEEAHWAEIAFAATEHMNKVSTRGRALYYYLPHLLAGDQAERAEELVAEVVAKLPADDLHPALLLSSLARHAFSGRRWDQAAQWLESASARANQPLHWVEIEGLRGQLALAHGRIEIAAAAFTREHELVDRVESIRVQSRVDSTLHRADLRLATGQTALLERLIGEALIDPELAAADPGLRAALQLRLAIGRMADERLGIISGQSAADLLREVVADPAARDDDRVAAHLRMAHIALHHERWDEAEQALDQVPGQLSTAHEIYRVALTARAERRRGGSGSRAAELREAWQRLIIEPGRRGTSHGGSGVLHFERVRLLLSELIEAELLRSTDADAVWRAIEHVEQARSLTRLHTELAASAPTIDRLRNDLLTGGETVAVFVPAPDESHLFLIDAVDISHYRLPPRDAIERARIALHERMQDFVVGGQPSAGRRALLAARARALASLLFPAAAEARLRGASAVTIVGIDLIGAVPWSALTFSDGVALGDVCPIAAWPSIAVALALSDARSARAASAEQRDRVVLLAGVELSPAQRSEYPEARPFELTEPDAQRWVAHYRRSTLLLGRQATMPGLRDSLGPDVAVTQLLVHGVRDARSGGDLSLLLYEADGVTATPATAFDALTAPPVAFVTACGAGLGPMRLGDPGATDITGPLLRAGAEVVVVPLCDISYQATKAFSEVFHRSLAQGRTVAQSLQHARRELERGRTWVDPTHHSAFLAVGLAHAPLFASGSPPDDDAAGGNRTARTWGGLGAALAAFLGLALVVRGLRRSRKP